VLSIDQALARLADRFSKYERPLDFINASHCCECAEHFAALLDVPVGQLRQEHVGDGAWDPTCFLTPDAFRYYLPGMCRIATADRYWLEMLAPRLSLWYVDSLDATDRVALKKLLEAWWLDEATPEGPRLAVERALDHYQ